MRVQDLDLLFTQSTSIDPCTPSRDEERQLQQSLQRRHELLRERSVQSAVPERFATAFTHRPDGFGDAKRCINLFAMNTAVSSW